MYKLADATYETNHRFFVDGPITVGDAYNGTTWKTILVGGLGRGGRGFYALDVTDPAVPKALWEFGTAQDSDIGYSYGNAIITKRATDGKWVVIFASGYNNNLSPGDSKGRLYVVDAFTGEPAAGNHHRHDGHRSGRERHRQDQQLGGQHACSTTRPSTSTGETSVEACGASIWRGRARRRSLARRRPRWATSRSRFVRNWDACGTAMAPITVSSTSVRAAISGTAMSRRDHRRSARRRPCTP